MVKGKKVVVVMPAYNAAKTIERTYAEVVEHDIVDLVVIVDDASRDETIELASQLPRTELFVHTENRGYGANQKTCYRLALDRGADIVIMVHPDYQYTPKLIPAMAALIAEDLYPCVLGSRVLGRHALKGGMPIWKYYGNRILSLTENVIFGAKLSEYHSGYRAFSRELLESLPLEENSDGFVFDNEILAEILWHGHTIAEVSCPTRYFSEASSIGFGKSVAYGLGCIATAVSFRLAKLGLIASPRFPRHADRPSA